MDNKENQLIFFLIGFMVLSITGLILFFSNSQPKNSTPGNDKIEENNTNQESTAKNNNKQENTVENSNESVSDNSNSEKKEDNTIKFTEAEKISSSIARDNALGYLNQISKSVVQKSFKDSYIYNLNGTYIISDNGKVIKSTSNENEVYEIYYTGTYPSGGTLIYQNDKIQVGSTIIVSGFKFEIDDSESLIYNENKEN